jgi:phage terminase large subunit-like protein
VENFTPQEVQEMLHVLETRKRKDSFDPSNPGSKPNKPQQRVFSDIGKPHAKWRILRWANQCLVEGTLVATSKGAIPIEKLKVGDEVYDEHGEPIKVINTFNSGEKECVTIYKNKQAMVDCSLEHKWWTYDRHYERPTKKLTKELTKHDKVATQWDNQAFEEGGKQVLDSYFLGAFIGDGCINHAEDTDSIFISGEDEEVLERISLETGASYTKNKGSNYTWTFRGIDSPLYDTYLKGKYSHEKYIPKEELATWDRESLCDFLAGLIDTDGSVYDGPDQSNLTFTSNCWESISLYQWLLMSLFHVQGTIIEDEREKYNHPCYNIKISNRFHISRILTEVKTQIPRKQWHRRFTEAMYRFNPKGASITTKPLGMRQTYNLTVEGKNNVYTLANGMVTSNSGKTATAAWELAKVVTETHPWWKKPKDWGEGPIKAIVAGQDRKMMELEIWEGKLLPHLDKNEWHVVKSGQSISHVTHKPTGNQIIFLSHSDGSDKARRHMQGYVVNYVWIDEMPISIKIWEELEKRIISKNGYLIATFTPKVKNEAIKRVVDNHCAQSYCQLYKASMLENPILADRIDDLVAKMEGYPESYKAAVLHGDWYVGDSGVYMWDEAMVEGLPENYSHAWRHVEWSDPAMDSKMGHIIAVEEPSTGKWFMKHATYLKGLASPRAYVEESLVLSAKVQIKRRVCDPAATWFMSTGVSEFGVNYVTPFNKTGRKDELIKGLQKALSDGRLKITPECVDFINEVSSCQWSETSPGKIVNAQSYHLLDAAQYGIDCLPKWDGPSTADLDILVEAKLKHRKKQEDRMKKAQQQREIIGMRARRKRTRVKKRGYIY